MMAGPLGPLFAGAVAGCGALLLVAGLGKAYRSARERSAGSAIATALRLGPHGWRRVEFAAGALECATGAALLTGFHPVLSGAAAAALGTVFAGLLGYLRLARVPGECGCVWRARRAEARVGYGVVVRAAGLVAAGLVEASTRLPRPAAGTGPWFVVLVAGAVTLAAMLGVDRPVPVRGCRRPLWFPVRRIAGALAGHPAFAAMARSAGPFTDGFTHRHSGCTDEFRFTPATRPGRAVVFRVVATGRALAVHATVEAAERDAP